MLQQIIAFSIKNKLIVGLLMVGLIAWGSYETTRLPIDAVPDITNNQVQVITQAPSFGATDIERLVTFPVEQANSNIQGLKEIRSFSRFGLSLVTIVFDESTDIYWARQQVAERLQQVQSQIPVGIGRPELGPITTGLGEIYQYMVRPKKGYEQRYDATELRTIQDWVIRRQLLGVPGVAEVSSFGGKLKQYEIAVVPQQLQAYGVTMEEIFQALEANNQNTGGAYIEKGPTVLFIRSEGLVGSLEDIGQIAVKTSTLGTPVLLRDVADIRLGYATRYGAMCYNDEGEVTGAIVMMLKGANSSEVVKAVKARMAQIEKTLPEGVAIEPFLDRTKMVNNAIGTVEKNLLEGALIVVFMLVLFLGNFRAGLLVASVIPLSMLFAIIMMNAFGVSGNLMSLGALDFGLIVDGAVIIVEAVLHYISHHSAFKKHLVKQEEMDGIVQQSASRMMNSAVFGQLIILIVYLPIFSLQGIEGKMFKPMAQTVAFALVGAFLLSLTYVPMMSALVLERKGHSQPNFSDRMMARLTRGYERLLSRALRMPKIMLGATVILFAGAVLVLTTLGGEFIPELEEGDLAVETRVLTGSSLTTSIAYTQQAAGVLKKRFPEVEKVVTKIGSGEVPTDPMPMEASDMMVILKDKKEWTSAKTFDELEEKMAQALEDVPGITAGFQFPVQMRFNELMTGARQDVVCKIFGEDLDTLSKYAGKLAQIAERVRGAANMYVETVTGTPQILIEYNRAAIAQHRLTIADVNRVVNAAFAGQTAGQVFEGEKRFDLVVRLSSDMRQRLEDVQQLLIPTPMGNQVPLQQLATVSIKDGPYQIQREDAKRRIVVGFNVQGRDVQSIVDELQQKVSQAMRLPAGYYVVYGGAFENLQAARQRLSIAVPVSLLLIFVLLYFAFGSIRQGLLIYTAIPLSAIGGILLLAARGLPFSISAGVGFIALFGVAVLNGIVLIAEFNRLRQVGITNKVRLVMSGTRTRLRPVLMTACVASFGFLPMALSHGAGAEVQRPLATVVIGGLLIATMLTLFVLPLLYLHFGIPKMKKDKAAAIALLLVFAGIGSVQAQKPISLAAAWDSAARSNRILRQEAIRIDYYRQLKASAYALPATNISTELGQINSAYTDNRIAVTQNVAFPTVYRRQHALLSATWEAAILNRNLKQAEVKRITTELFYTIRVLREKERLLIQADSIYAAFLQRAQIRLQAGETDVLEQATATSQRGQIQMQLEALRRDLDIAIIQFNLLLLTNQLVAPEKGKPTLEWQTVSSPQPVKEHPLLQLARQQQTIARAQTRLEQSRLLPEWTAGYYNMTMRGTGADDVRYGSSQRFQAVMAGISVPFASGAVRSRIRAAKLGENLAAMEVALQDQQLQLEYRSALRQWQYSRERIQWYENTGLEQARIIREAATRQFQAGQINFLEWTLLMNQSIDLQHQYLETIQTSNEQAAKLQYLTNQY